MGIVMEELISEAKKNKLTVKELALVANAAAANYRAKKNADALKVLTDVLEENVKFDAASPIEVEKQDALENVFIGNALYVAFKTTNDKKYEAAAITIAKQFNNQPRSESGYFLGADGKDCLCNSFFGTSFYMNYETMNGGKERYNDVIAQFNAMDTTVYQELRKDINKNYTPIAFYAAALIDTMEIMDQALYEIFGKLRDYLKVVVKDIIEYVCKDADKKAMNKAEKADVIMAYAILKACRMNILHTEKYEGIALSLLAKVDDSIKNDIETSALYVIADSEVVKNRAYQDYGRLNGGVLWS